MLTMQTILKCQHANIKSVVVCVTGVTLWLDIHWLHYMLTAPLTFCLIKKSTPIWMMDTELNLEVSAPCDGSMGSRSHISCIMWREKGLWELTDKITVEDLMPECMFGNILDLNLIWTGNLIILKWLWGTFQSLRNSPVISSDDYKWPVTANETIREKTAINSYIVVNARAQVWSHINHMEIQIPDQDPSCGHSLPK